MVSYITLLLENEWEKRDRTYSVLKINKRLYRSMFWYRWFSGLVAKLDQANIHILLKYDPFDFAVIG